MARLIPVRALALTALFLTLAAGAVRAEPAQRVPARDKLLHLGVSAVIAAATTQAAHNQGRADCDAARLGLGVTLAIGAAKELHDRRPGGSGWSWPDMVWNLLGGALGAVIVSGCH